MKFLKNFTDKQVYLSLVFVSIALVAAVAGVRNLSREQQKNEIQQEIESSQLENISEPVISSKNAPNSTTDSNDKETSNVTKKDAEEEKTEESAIGTTGSSAQGYSFIWPVSGDIVMDYSVEHAIFDTTLNQYRTNDSVCISAAEGTDVKASAAGTVTGITTDSKNGISLVIDHGNGWKTTYGQLKDLSVSEGSMVNGGQVIGSIASPSKYSVLLGSHLDFTVAYNDETVDPKGVVAK